MEERTAIVRSERLAELRRYAQRHNPDTERRWAEADYPAPNETDRHLYDGGCPWCRADEIDSEYHIGGAHEWALRLLDEIDRLRLAITNHQSEVKCCDECVIAVTEDRSTSDGRLWSAAIWCVLCGRFVDQHDHDCDRRAEQT